MTAPATPDFAALPPFLQDSFERLLALGARFYVAWHPDFPRALVRQKTAAALAATWLPRDWTRFDGKTPTISDVTEAIPHVWVQMLEAPSMRRRLTFRPPTALELLPDLRPAPTDSFDATDPGFFDDMMPSAADRCCLGGILPWYLPAGVFCYLCGHQASGENDVALVLSELDHVAATGHDDWLVCDGDAGEEQVRTRRRGGDRPWRSDP